MEKNIQIRQQENEKITREFTNAFSEASERRKSKSQWGTLFEFIEEIQYMCSGEATN